MFNAYILGCCGSLMTPTNDDYHAGWGTSLGRQFISAEQVAPYNIPLISKMSISAEDLQYGIAMGMGSITVRNRSR